MVEQDSRNPTVPGLDCPRAAQLITRFIIDYLADARAERIALSLSGGLDSAVVACLCAGALGADRVLAIYLPSDVSAPESEGDAKLVASELGMTLELIDIAPQLHSYFTRFPDASVLRRANKAARERMSVMYDISAREDAVVAGCGNKTEWLLGYTTHYGDNACALRPIGDLYKTQVRLLADHIGVPRRIIEKPPSADLWPGQTDEGELGFSYDEVDRLLWMLIEENLSEAETIQRGIQPELVKRVVEMIRRGAFKRSIPPACIVPDNPSSGRIPDSF